MPTNLITPTARAASLIGTGRAVAAGVVSAKVMLLLKGVMKAMSLSKVKFIAAVMLGVGLLASGMRAASLIDPTQAKHEAGATAGASPANNTQALQGKRKVSAGAEHPGAPPDGAVAMQGVWTGVLTEIGGRRAAPSENLPLPEARIHVKDDRLTLSGMTIHGNSVGFARSVETIFMLTTDATKTPRTIELTLPPWPDDIAPTTYLGIYRLEGDDLTICLSPPNKKRPSEIKSQEKTHQLLLKLKRSRESERQESPPKPLLHRQPGDVATAKSAVRSETIRALPSQSSATAVRGGGQTMEEPLVSQASIRSAGKPSATIAYEPRGEKSRWPRAILTIVSLTSADNSCQYVTISRRSKSVQTVCRQWGVTSAQRAALQ